MYLSILLEVEPQGVNVVVKPQSGHRKEDVVSRDSLPLLLCTLVTCPGGTVKEP